MITLLLLLAALASPAAAQCCFMGPPPPPTFTGTGPLVERSDMQRTFVFFKDGVQSMVVKPGIKSKVAHFGMLLPLPSVPAIRKMPDDIFGQIARAIDPPQVLVDLRPQTQGFDLAAEATALRAGAPSSGNTPLVTVHKTEAVGMYQVAVLEAGSPAALAGWMERNGYRYPQGAEAVVRDYIEKRWCFVAIKTRVGALDTVNPRPGMRGAASLLGDQGWNGHLQAMGFRFETDQLVVPMRLAAFNQGEPRALIYVLTDQPIQAAGVEASYVRRQLDGAILHRNVTSLLPIRVIGGDLSDVGAARLHGLRGKRNPAPHNGKAASMFAADLQAVRSGRLANPGEELEKELLEIGEQLGLRGPEMDAHHAAALRDALPSEQEALADLAGMTLTILDGPLSEPFAEADVTVASYRMPAGQNLASVYNAVELGAPRATRWTEGHVFYEQPTLPLQRQPAAAGYGRAAALGLAAVLLALLVGLVVLPGRRGKLAS